MAEMTDELVVREAPPPVTLFGPTDPTLVLERMGEIATALVDVIDQKHLYKTISGRKHILVEGWTTLGAMLGVTPHVIDVRPNETGDGYLATVEARTLDGRVVGTAQAECSRAEKTWANRDSYALRSMAQTRAISRTLRAALGMVVVFAGYEATPAEEMPSAADTKRQARMPKAAAGQLSVIGDLLILLGEKAPEVDWRRWARETSGGVGAGELTVSQAGSLIRRLEDELASRTVRAGSGGEGLIVEATYYDPNDPVEEHSKYEAPASVRQANEQQVEEELAEFADPVEPPED